MTKKLIKTSLFNALATAVYITLVALLMFNGDRIFGSDDNSVITPISVLLLFVVSAGITASFVLLKPVMTYLDGQKKEAVMLLTYTLAWLFFFTIIALALNMVF